MFTYESLLIQTFGEFWDRGLGLRLELGSCVGIRLRIIPLKRSTDDVNQIWDRVGVFVGDRSHGRVDFLTQAHVYDRIVVPVANQVWHQVGYGGQIGDQVFEEVNR